MVTTSGAWLKNPYFISGDSVKSRLNKTFIQNFLLCVDIDGQRKVIEKTSIHFNSIAEDALIEVDGENVDLMNYLMSGGDFVLEDVRSWGMPSYDELEVYFTDSFDDLLFVEGPFTWFFKIWGLQRIKFARSGIELFGNFEFE